MLKVLSVMAQGHKIWENCSTGTFTLMTRHKGKAKPMRVQPRTIHALDRQGLIMKVGEMTPVYFRQEWNITRLGEIEVFERSK